MFTLSAFILRDELIVLFFTNQCLPQIIGLHLEDLHVILKVIYLAELHKLFEDLECNTEFDLR